MEYRQAIPNESRARPRRILQVNDDRADCGRGDCDLSGRRSFRPILVALPILALWFVSPSIAWWISQPIESARRFDWQQLSFCGSLRERPGRSSKTFVGRKKTGCRRIIIRSIPVPSLRIARRPQIWDLRCSPICPHTTLVTFRRDNSSSARRMRFDTMEAGTAPRPLLQLVRHALAATAASALRVDRGQRKPCGPPADACGRVCSRSPIRRSWGRDSLTGSATHSGPGWMLPLREPRLAHACSTSKASRVCPRFPADYAHGSATLPRPADDIHRGGAC